MKRGHLSGYFVGIAAKNLSSVEADPRTSNQHEFNGVNPLKDLFGDEKERLPAKFLFLDDDRIEPVAAEGFVTWYDARANHPTRSEYRLYFPTSAVSESASEGDLLVICLRPDRTVLVVIAKAGSTIANQVAWLFGLSSKELAGFEVKKWGSAEGRLAYASKTVLEQIGVEVDESDAGELEELVRAFPDGFPTTREFSAYARDSLPDVCAVDDPPDSVLMQWMEREEHLFRLLERHIIGKRLERGFGGDVDAFITFSLSVQNRRKSRVGHALENHLQHLFQRRGIRHSKGAVSENRSKPDFLFPSAEDYRDPTFDALRLTMLGAKSTCKDRWRQVLAEAARIDHKHLLTLETAISRAQTDEMKANRVQLVVPRPLHSTFEMNQQEWLMDVDGFLNLVKQRQEK